MFRLFKQLIPRRKASHQTYPAFLAGDICSIESGDGHFGVVKILAIDERAVHIRCYRNEYNKRPVSVRTSDLTLGAAEHGFGIGHLPLSHAAFAAWQPVRITNESVMNHELDGYRIWLEGGGGVWGMPP